MKSISPLVILLISFFISESSVSAREPFPRSPELTVTPGRLCHNPSKFRYPENIAYCERDVTYQTKEYVINNYDQSFGFRIAQLKREDFKIDHLIPLCVGGANDASNLWPQHKSVYTITDPLEPVLCAKMYEGKLKQNEAVLLIIEAKTHLDRVQKIYNYVNSL